MNGEVYIICVCAYIYMSNEGNANSKDAHIYAKCSETQLKKIGPWDLC